MSIQPARLNFSVIKGATFRKVFFFHEGDRNSPVRNLTGFTARMTIRSQTATLATLTTENSGILIGGLAGSITLFMSDEDTTLATWKLGSYTLFLLQGGDANPLIYGNFLIKAL